MKVEAISFAKFFSNKNTIYKNIMIVSKRARQIISSRYEEHLALTNIEDTDEIVAMEEQDHDKEKSISIAMDELLTNDLEYRNIEDDKDEEGDK